MDFEQFKRDFKYVAKSHTKFPFFITNRGLKKLFVAHIVVNHWQNEQTKKDLRKRRNRS